MGSARCWDVAVCGAGAVQGCGAGAMLCWCWDVVVQGCSALAAQLWGAAG